MKELKNIADPQNPTKVKTCRLENKQIRRCSIENESISHIDKDNQAEKKTLLLN